MNEQREQWAPVPIRVTIGSWLMYHGAPKLFTRRGNENIASMLGALGVPLPEVAGTGAGVLEFGGGLALVAGVRVKAFGALFFALLLGNMLLAARAGGFPEPLVGEQPLPNWESSTVFAAASLSLALTGAGPCSADSLRGR